MMPPPAIGLIDTGINGSVASARRFWLDAGGSVVDGPATPDSMGHGTVLAELIRDRSPGCELLCAQVFDHRGVASPLATAAGIHWLLAANVRLINMSFGLREDRQVLADACAQAIAAGVILVASAPAMGNPIFPASYPGIVKVTGDARCEVPDVSVLGGGTADFGASPRLPTGRMIAGASVAAARITAELALILSRKPDLSNADALARLRAQARYQGPQTEHLDAR